MVIFEVVLFLGNEIYQGSGVTIKHAKQQAAVQVFINIILSSQVLSYYNFFYLQALQNTKYQSKEEQKAAVPTLRETF